MKYSKKCPKCGSRDIFLMDNDRSADGMQNGNAAGMTYYSNVTVQQYICCKCGYSEQWVDRLTLAGIPSHRNVYQLNK